MICVTIVFSLIILIGQDLLMRIIDKENELPKLNYKQIIILIITNGLVYFLCNYKNLQIISISIFLGIIMYSAFCDYHTREIYDVPNIIGFILGIVIFSMSKGINLISLKYMGICILIAIVLTICRCINWGDTILFISIVPSLCLISSNPVYPFLIMVLLSSLLGVVFNVKNFIKEKKSIYAFAPYIYAGYVISVLVYGV